jgi:hypothetical protein
LLSTNLNRFKYGFLREIRTNVIGVTIALVFENIDNDMKNAERLEKTEATILLELKEHEICLEQIIDEQDMLLQNLTQVR